MRVQCIVSITLIGMLAANAAAGDFPGHHWKTSTPAEEGLDAARLEEIAQYLNGRGCVVRHGRMVFSWGDVSRRGDVASAAKPVYAHLLYAAEEEGLLESLDTPVVDYVPDLADLNEGLGHKDKLMTFAHMATQTSGYGVSEAPGTAFNYNDWQMGFLVDTMLMKVYRTTWEQADEEVLRGRLGEALQFEDSPTLLAFGREDRPGRLAISPRDFARFGLLYLNQGRWGEQQIISRERARRAVSEPLPNSLPQSEGKAADLIAGSTSIGSWQVPDNQTDHKGSYSWLWWVNGVDREGRRLWPDGPADVFAALGQTNGKRGMAVIPSLDVVIAWNDTTLASRPEAPHPLNEVFRLMMEAAVDGPMVGQVIVDPNRPAWLARYAGEGKPALPFFLSGAGDPEDFLYRGKLKEDGTRYGDQEDVIARMRGTGANAIYIQAVRSHGGDGDATHNPFKENDPARGVNETVLVQWEKWLRELDEAGIVTYFFIYDDSCKPWEMSGNKGSAMDETFVRTLVRTVARWFGYHHKDEVEMEETFLRTLARRFGHHRNLIWCIAEEYEEALTAEKVTRLAAILREADEHNHPIAIHKLNGLEFNEFAEDANIDQFAAQYNVNDADELNDALGKSFRRAGGRYSIILAEAAGWGKGEDLRRNLWACALAGAGSMVLGWTFEEANNPSLEDLEECGSVVKFMEQIDPRGLVPRNDLRAGATRWLATDGERRWVGYVNGGSAAAGVRGLQAGRYGLRWYDPAGGQWVENSKEFMVRGETRVLMFLGPTDEKPGDMVFHLERMD